MAVHGRSNRRLLQLVQQQLLAVGREGPLAAPCVQQLTALRAPAWLLSGPARTFGSSATLKQASSQRGQLLPHAARGLATEAAAGATRSRGPVSFVSLAITAATGGALLMYYNHLMSQKLQKSGLPKEAAAGRPMIGGPFELVDQNGKPFSDKDLLGSWGLLYFGFTFCPDICPDELEKMAAAIDAVEKEAGEKVQPVFISLDPERDSVKQVREYVKEFHPRLIGLTGPKEKTDAAAKAYRVYHMKTEETEDYLVDHSIIMYLINPRGDFVQFYGKNFDAPALAKAIQGHVTAWKPDKD